MTNLHPKMMNHSHSHSHSHASVSGAGIVVGTRHHTTVATTATPTTTSSVQLRRLRQAWFPLLFLCIASLTAIPNLFWHAGLTSSNLRNTADGPSNDAAASSPYFDAMMVAPSMTAMTAEKQRRLELRIEQMQESLDLLLLQQKQLLLVKNMDDASSNTATTTATSESSSTPFSTQTPLKDATATTAAASTTTTSESNNAPPPVVLPSCRALMSGPYSPFRTGDFLTSSTARHIWIPRADGSRQLDLSFPCTLHRYTANEARQCLRGKHVSLMGDSLSRYLFLSLAHFIHHGVWPPRFGQARRNFGYQENNNTSSNDQENVTISMRWTRQHTQPICPHIDEHGKPTCSPMDQPNVAMEGDWKHGLPKGQDSWETFLEQIGGATDGGIFNGHMECDCARSSRSGKGRSCLAECQVENELYISDPANQQGEWVKEMDDTSRPEQSDDDDDDIDYSQRILLSHVKENGWGDPARNVSGFSFTKCGATGSCRRDQNTTNFTLDRALEGVFEWNEPLADALQNSLKKILPPVNIGIYNKGLWGAVSEETLDRVMPALYNFTGGEDGRCFFRSTTGSPKSLKAKLEEHERGLVQRLTHQHGCSFLDFGRLTEDFARIEYRGRVDKSTPAYLLQERNSIYWDVVHFLPWVYEELNNIQLNVLCNTIV